MNVFICWSGSGSKSHSVALLLRDWLPMVIQALDPYVSSEDTDKGKLWRKQLNEKLEAAQYGVICLTPDNLDSQWINFEAGAIANRLNTQVTALLINQHPNQVGGPLEAFQHTRPERTDMFKFVNSLNNALPSSDKLGESRLRKSFDMCWSEFQEQYQKVVESEGVQIQEPEDTRSTDEVVRGLESTISEVAEVITAVLRATEENTQEILESNSNIAGIHRRFSKNHSAILDSLEEIRSRQRPKRKKTHEDDSFDPDDELPF